jgi:hypothetical protein
MMFPYGESRCDFEWRQRPLDHKIQQNSSVNAMSGIDLELRYILRADSFCVAATTGRIIMGYLFSSDGAGSPGLTWLLRGAEVQFNEPGVTLMAQATDAPTNAGGAPTGASDSGPQLPVIEADSALYICPPTKHPVLPCVRVALIETHAAHSIESESLYIGVAVVGILVAVLVGFFLGRLARR